jgi:hypothetical protein
MIACTRCGHWHTDAEKNNGKRLSCTEVKGYWGQIRRDHMDAYGHVAQLMKDDSGNWVCLKCRRCIRKVGE